jgi:hypothetical protein
MLENYRLLDADWLLSNEGDKAVWQAELVDDNNFLVCEVWNNGDDGGNFYVWHEMQTRWGLYDAVKAKYPDAEHPMDLWIEELRNAKNQETS